jgi:hypothetical protein
MSDVTDSIIKNLERRQQMDPSGNFTGMYVLTFSPEMFDGNENKYYTFFTQPVGLVYTFENYNGEEIQIKTIQ